MIGRVGQEKTNENNGSLVSTGKLKQIEEEQRQPNQKGWKRRSEGRNKSTAHSKQKCTCGIILLCTNSVNSTHKAWGQGRKETGEIEFRQIQRPKKTCKQQRCEGFLHRAYPQQTTYPIRISNDLLAPLIQPNTPTFLSLLSSRHDTLCSLIVTLLPLPPTTPPSFPQSCQPSSFAATGAGTELANKILKTNKTTKHFRRMCDSEPGFPLCQHGRSLTQICACVGRCCSCCIDFYLFTQWQR